MKRDPLAVYLNRVAVDHRGDASHVGQGWGGEQAEGDGEGAHGLPHTLPLRPGAVVQAERSSVLICWWRLAARQAVQYEEHD